VEPRGRGLHRRGPEWPVRRSAFFPLVLLACAHACTFEPRDTPADDASTADEGDTIAGAPLSAELSEAAALQTIEHFRASVTAGDLSRALAVVDGDATLVDALVGEASEAATRGELLLELRRRHAEGISLEATSSRVTLFPGGIALVVSRLRVLERDPDGVATEAGQMHETVLLVGSPEGWRIRNLHRSFLAGDPPPDSLRT
jgi:hypothetical protein